MLLFPPLLLYYSFTQIVNLVSIVELSSTRQGQRIKEKKKMNEDVGIIAVSLFFRRSIASSNFDRDRKGRGK